MNVCSRWRNSKDVHRRLQPGLYRPASSLYSWSVDRKRCRHLRSSSTISHGDRSFMRIACAQQTEADMTATFILNLDRSSAILTKFQRCSARRCGSESATDQRDLHHIPNSRRARDWRSRHSSSIWVTMNVDQTNDRSHGPLLEERSCWIWMYEDPNHDQAWMTRKGGSSECSILIPTVPDRL